MQHAFILKFGCTSGLQIHSCSYEAEYETILYIDLTYHSGSRLLSRIRIRLFTKLLFGGNMFLKLKILYFLQKLPRFSFQLMTIRTYFTLPLLWFFCAIYRRIRSRPKIAYSCDAEGDITVYIYTDLP